MKFRFFLLFLFLIKFSLAQEMWGISNSNYSGSMGLFLNPSTIVAAPYNYEFTLIAADLFAENTYIYAPADRHIITRSLFGTAPRGKNWFDIYKGATQKGFAHALFIGPSYINSSKRSSAWSIHTAYRNEASVLDIPTDLAKYVYENYKYPPFENTRFTTGSFSAAWLRWAEIGGTYGKVYMEKEKDFIKWAATVNILFGMGGLYLDARSLDYTVVDTTLAIVHAADATIAQSFNPNNTSVVGGLFPVKGLGLSTTLGVTYMHKRHPGSYECGEIADNIPKYQYRIGLSLMDFGFLHFFNQTRIMTLQTNTDRPLNRLDTIRFGSFNNFDLNALNFINGSTQFTDHSFSMFLPTAISLQFDYAFTKNIYGNASWVNRVYYTVKEVARGNQFDISGRYEKRKWEADLDYTLFEYKQSALGVGFRYSFFVIGTDRLLEWIGVSDVDTFDFFFGLKFNFCEWPFKKKDCPAYQSMN